MGLFIEKKRVVSLNNALKKQEEMKKKPMTTKEREIFNRVHKRTLNRIQKLKKNEETVKKQLKNRIVKLRKARNQKVKETFNKFKVQKAALNQRIKKLKQAENLKKRVRMRRGDPIFEKYEPKQRTGRKTQEVVIKTTRKGKKKA